MYNQYHDLLSLKVQQLNVMADEQFFSLSKRVPLIGYV